MVTNVAKRVQLRREATDDPSAKDLIRRHETDQTKTHELEFLNFKTVAIVRSAIPPGGNPSSGALLAFGGAEAVQSD